MAQNLPYQNRYIYRLSEVIAEAQGDGTMSRVRLVEGLYRVVWCLGKSQDAGLF